MRKDRIEELRPPRWGRWILSRILPAQLKPTASADFEEIYARILTKSGVKKANCWYWKSILMAAVPFLFTAIHWRFIMIKEYLKLTFRHSRRRKGVALINMGGLAVALASCILVFYFIRDEFSFDRFHTHIDSIYEVKSKVMYKGDSEVFLETEGPVGPTLAADFYEVEAATRMAKADLIVQTGDKIFRQKGIGVDPSFLDVFSFPLVGGDSATALKDPDSVVLSAETAQLFFGSGDPLGEVISLKIGNDTSNYVVSGITGEIPANSSITYDLLLPILRVKGTKLDLWNTGLDAACFIRLGKGTNPKALEAKFSSTIDKYLSSEGSKGSHYLFPFADYHKGHGSYSFSSILEPRSSPSYSYILAGIAFLVLLIAGFNFMNLSVAAAAAGRIKEIGMRKVLGAERKQLFHQFSFEGMLLSLASLALGFLIALTVLPVFNRFAGKELHLDLLGQGFPLLVLILFAALLGILAGFYPGWLLSRVRPVDLFRGRFLLGRKSSFNRVFLLFQFGISMFLIITTGFLYRQHQHLLKADLGYVPERVVVLNLRHLTPQFQQTSDFLPKLKSRLLQYPEIKSVSGAYSGMSSWSAIIGRPVGTKDIQVIRFNNVDEDFIETLGISMAAGRWFSSEFPSDKSDAVVVNEAFIRRFNVTEPIERTVSEFFRFRGPEKIIGVVRDFNFDSLRRPIEPAMINLTIESESVQKVFIKLEAGDISRSINIIKKEFAAAVPGYPFLYSFLDDEVANQYESERHWSFMVAIVCLFAILIACSGAFALALKMAASRTKEIGIRKVLGASVFRIIGILVAEFVLIAGASVILAWPASFFTMHKVLADYPYRIPLSFWMFFGGGVLVVALTLATVGLQALRSSVKNPVESLRLE